MKIDLYNTKRNLKHILKAIETLPVPPKNRTQILDFLDCCLVGWNGTKLSPIRVVKYASHLKQIALLLGDREFDYLTKSDIRKLLAQIDQEKGDWAQYDYRIALRKFMNWLREEHGYPEDYPDREEHLKALEMVKLGVAKHALEVSKIKIKRPDKLRDRSKIPTSEHLRYLREAAMNSRDRAFFAVLEEVGPRPGGICTRLVRDVEFDDLGAKIYLHDKTMRGEPVRLTWSAAYLRQWLEVHPFRDDPEAPLWINLHKSVDRPVPLDYAGFRAIEVRARTRHNRMAGAKGLPVLPPMDLYGFRYHAQIRDELNGVPRSVQMRQRGWKYNSRMPDRYARLAAGDVDRYYRKKLGLNGDEDEKEPAPCPRCREVNLPETTYCKRCGLPLSEEGVKHKEAVTRLAFMILQDPELRDEFLKTLKQRKQEF